MIANRDIPNYIYMDNLNRLKARLKGRVVLLGMGNTLKSDDGLGTILAKRLEGKSKMHVFSGGVMPENYLEKIVRLKPDTILIVDAADFGGQAGEWKLLKPEEIHTLNFFSTHNMSPALMIDYLQKSTSADIMFLAIQPKDIGFGERLSAEIEKRIGELERFFTEL